MTNTANDGAVLIIGGGMAGSAWALELAKRGIPSQVIDKSTFPREKVCGEGLLPEGVSLLENLVGTDALRHIQAQTFQGIHYRSGTHEAIDVFVTALGGAYADTASIIYFSKKQIITRLFRAQKLKYTK